MLEVYLDFGLVGMKEHVQVEEEPKGWSVSSGWLN